MTRSTMSSGTCSTAGGFVEAAMSLTRLTWAVRWPVEPESQQFFFKQHISREAEVRFDGCEFVRARIDIPLDEIGEPPVRHANSAGDFHVRKIAVLDVPRDHLSLMWQCHCDHHRFGVIVRGLSAWMLRLSGVISRGLPTSPA